MEQSTSTAPAGVWGAPVKAISPLDVATLVGLPPLVLSAWLLPERSWPRIGRLLAPLVVSTMTSDRQRIIGTIARVTEGAKLEASPIDILHGLAAGRVEAMLQTVRSHRPDRWRPAIDFAGRSHIDAALGQGKGAVLWVSYTVHCDLIVKMALHGQGILVDHLSRGTHGFSKTRWGQVLLNPIVTRVENRFIADRIVLDEADPGASLRVLETRLRENHAVTVTVHRNAVRPIRPNFLNGRMTLAPGAPLLAYRAGAPLLPVFSFRDHDGRFKVIVEAPLDVPHGLGTGEALERAGAEYGARLEPYVLSHPEQWRGWMHL